MLTDYQSMSVGCKAAMHHRLALTCCPLVSWSCFFEPNLAHSVISPERNLASGSAVCVIYNGCAQPRCWVPCLQASRGSKAGDDTFTAEQAATPDEEQVATPDGEQAATPDEEQAATSAAVEAFSEVPAAEPTDATAGGAPVADAVNTASMQEATSPTANIDAPGSFTPSGPAQDKFQVPCAL